MVAIFQLNQGKFSTNNYTKTFSVLSCNQDICTVLLIKGDAGCFKDRISLVYLFACVAPPAENLWRVAVFWIDADHVGSPESAAGKCHFPLDVPGK